ncbi:hypothetical protein HZB89_00960 [archaeon]|nr:hypothetical protein [archaeon]
MILSSQPTLQVTPLNISLKGIFVIDSLPAAGAMEATAMLSIHNDGAKAENARISIELPDEGLSTESIQQELASIDAGETKYLPLNLKADRLGSYRLNCIIELPDYNKKFSCQENRIEFSEQSLPIEAGIGAAVLIIGVIVYLYIYSWSRKP